MELFTKIFELYQVSQRFQYSHIVYIENITQLKSILFLFSHRLTHQSSTIYWDAMLLAMLLALILHLILFLIALRYSNLICQTKILIRIIVLGSFSSKSLSRLILLRSILRMPVSLRLNKTLPQSSLK